MALNDSNHGGSSQSAERDSGLDRLYQAAERQDPPPRLDAAILAAAHREVGARPRALASTLRTWRVPASIAAVVVLSVSLVTLVREEGGDELVQPGSPGVSRPAAPAPPLPQPAREAPKAAAPAAPAAERALRRDFPADQAATREATEESARRDSARQARETGAGPAPGQAARTGPRPFQTSPDAGAGPPAAPISGADDRGGGPAASAERSAPSAAPGSAAEAAGGLARESRRPAPAPSPVPRGERDIAPGDPGSAVRGMGAPAASDAPAERPRAQGELRAQKREGPQAGATRIAPLLKEFDAQPPEKWLERIQELKRQGRPAEAEEMLAEFKRRFPAHPLPSGLQ